MAVSIENRKRVSQGLKSWTDDVATYERAFKDWEGRVDKIQKRYRDDPRTGKTTWTSAKFNVLWSNVQTLVAATFSRLPKPDVSRRYRDQDPTGRVASMILERDLDYHVQHYPEYRTAIKASVLDRFLGARGTSWIRYEPHFRAAQKGEPVDGDQVTEDVDTPDEELDYECVAVDYVHWKDFGHSVARTWEEVPRVWRKVYMTRDALDSRFGKDISKLIPLDADPRQSAPDKAYGSQDQRLCATIYEGWDKSEKRAVWFSKSVKDFLDVKEIGDESYVDFEDGFPCPRPLYGTLTNDSLVPVPDFVIYQDQANELDLLADRIDGLIKALKVAGGYDASVPELQRIFTEAENGTLIPIKNWQAFAEKNGLVGALSLVDLKPIADALISAYQAFEQVKNQIYDLTGISDIVRGQSDAQETATAQQIKGQYASLRLKTYQDEVARYASDTLVLMAQVICRKFSAETIAKIAGVEQLMPQDQQVVPQAIALLIGPERMQNPDAPEGPNAVRSFRIEVASDSMVHLDEQAEQEARVNFLTATGGYLVNMSKALEGVPPQMVAAIVPLLMDMLKFGVTGFRVGKQLEGAFDEATEKVKQIAQQPPPPPQEPPEVMVEKMKLQAETERAQAQMALDREKGQAELTLQQQKQAGEQQLQREKMIGDWQLEDAKHQREMEQRARESDDEVVRNVKDAFTQHEGKVKDMVSQSERKQEVAGVKQQADQKVSEAKQEGKAREQEAKAEGAEREKAAKDDTAATVQKELKELGESIKALIENMNKPKRIVRGKDGRASGVETVQ